MNGRTDGWVWPRALNLNHLRVYGRAVALRRAVREMFGQCVKQKGCAAHALSEDVFCLDQVDVTVSSGSTAAGRTPLPLSPLPVLVEFSAAKQG